MLGIADYTERGLASPELSLGISHDKPFPMTNHSSLNYSSLLVALASLLLAGTGCSQSGMSQHSAIEHLTPEQLEELRNPPPQTYLAVQSGAPSLGPPTSQPQLPPAVGGDDQSFMQNLFRDFGVKETAADALARIGEEAVPSLIVALSDPDPDVRAHAARAVAILGPKAQSAVPALIRLLHDPDDYVRRNAARALGQIGPAAKDAIPSLIELLKEPESSSPSDRSRA
jgi:HEAT repeat protein